MKRLSVFLLIAVILAGGGIFAMAAPSSAQFYEYATPPPNPYTQPWVGSNTPWVYYNGDWFLNGILYYFFGPQYGWAPYYAYPPTYIVRPPAWYAPRWQSWYQGHPHFWQHFQSAYPYWRTHRLGQRYDERFFEEHHHGQPSAWQKGFQGRPALPPRREGQGMRPGAPPAGAGPAPGHFAPTERQRPGPARLTPPEEQRSGPSRMAPTKRQVPPSQMAPPAAHGPVPGQAAPRATQKPAPEHKAAPAPKPKKAAASPGAPQPEKGGHGEERH